ncbi:MAG: GGDEF domain-containing protein, partial [Spirochaetia bacterium]|nr:GGDEF domain-containing protein [Spirochaetia bacterium]
LEFIKRPYITLISILMLLLGAVHLFVKSDFSGADVLIHSISFIFIPVCIYFFYKGKRLYKISLYLLTFIYFINFLFLFAFNLGNANYLIWFPVFAFVFFFINGFQKGLFVFLSFSSLLIMITFLEYEKISVFPEITLLGSVAAYIAIAAISLIQSKFIENQDLFLKSKAKYDYLTGIFNRRAFLDNLYREYDFVKRNRNLSLSLLLLDIDHFKMINKKFGQETGDRILIEVKDLILNHLRSTDIFARWGSEEFIIAAVDTSPENAALLSEKLKTLIESHSFNQVGNISISIAVAGYENNDHIDSLIKKAEKVLKEIKSNALNRSSASS